MTTLADLHPGDAYILIARVTSRDATGLGHDLYTTSGQRQGTLTIANPGGAIGGQVTTSPVTSVPVTTVTRWTAVGVGDVLARNSTGETMVARAVDLTVDGTFLWYPSVARQVAYSMDDWTRVGHVDL